MAVWHWALSPHFTKPGHTTTSTPANCTWVYQPKKQGCDASLQNKSIVLSWIIYAGRGLCRSQPLKRIVEISVSFPWVYTLPLPYSLQPHPNILLHFIYCLTGLHLWSSVGTPFRPLAGLLTTAASCRFGWFIFRRCRWSAVSCNAELVMSRRALLPTKCIKD